MIRAIIVDDEYKSRESLKILLQDFCDNVVVEALCQNVKEGVEAVNKYNPDLVFLDIQMQRETGFDLLTQLDPVTFDVIFTTAYAEYAIKAFRFSALDYLLKPIDIDELRRAVEKVEKKRSNDISSRLHNLIQNLSVGAQTNLKLTLPTNDGMVFVQLSDILYCEAASNYTIVHTIDNKKYVVSKTLRHYEDLLSANDFFRIHNSYLINMATVKKYVRGEGGYVILTNDVKLDVSKRRKDAFLALINSK